MSDTSLYERIATYLCGQTHFRPAIAIICGSGLSNLSRSLDKSETFSYDIIPEFPSTTIEGHTGELVFGWLGNTQCVCFRGRFHYYEGASMDHVILPIRVVGLMGVKLVVVTTNSGGLNPDFNVGDVMVIQDHFGLTGSNSNPLKVENEAVGPRFPSLSDAYDRELQTMVMEAAEALGLQHKVRPDGTYCHLCGPRHETMAEARYLRGLGGDSVGASTYPEVIAAKHCGMKVLGLSLVTNKVVFKQDKHTQHASHAEVLQAVADSDSDIESILKRMMMTTDSGKRCLSDYLAALPPPLVGALTMASILGDAASKIPPSKPQSNTTESSSSFTPLPLSLDSDDDLTELSRDNRNVALFPNPWTDMFGNVLICLGVMSVCATIIPKYR